MMSKLHGGHYNVNCIYCRADVKNCAHLTIGQFGQVDKKLRNSNEKKKKKKPFRLVYELFRFAKNDCFVMQSRTLCFLIHSFFFHKNVVFPAQAECSHFSADFRLKIFLYYS